MVFKIICDTVHSYIHLNELETNIINTKIFLRLQNIKQSPTAYLTYPSHHENRFIHSLGVMEMAGKMVSNALERSPTAFLEQSSKELGIDNIDKTKENLVQIARLAGLLHDIGHPPLSHLGESAIQKDDFLALYGSNPDFNEFVKARGGNIPKFHEFTTYCIIKHNEELGELLTNDHDYKNSLLNIFGPKPEGIFTTIYEIISSDIDADRADFLIRDGMTSGIGFGQYDVMRLVESMVLIFDEKNKLFHIVPTTAALSTVETFLIERYKIYKWLCYHPHVILTDTVFSYLIRKFLEWGKIPEHPLENLFNIVEFHYKKYIVNGLPFDDHMIWEKIRQAFLICNSLWETDTKWKDDIDLAYPLLRMVLFRENYAKAIFKNVSDYKSFDSVLRKDMIDQSIPFSDQLPLEPLLNRYAKKISGTVPLKEDERFDKNLSDEAQFIIETERTDFTPYSFEHSEVKMPVAGNGQSLLKIDYKSKYFLVDKKSGKKIVISDLSQIVKQLLEAWKNDMQLFLYIVRFEKPKKEEWPAIVESAKNKIKTQLISLWRDDKLR